MFSKYIYYFCSANTRTHARTHKKCDNIFIMCDRLTCQKQFTKRIYHFVCFRCFVKSIIVCSIVKLEHEHLSPTIIILCSSDYQH